MQDRKPNSRFPIARFIGIAGVILLLGGGTAWWAKYSLEKAEQKPIVNDPPLETITPKTPEKEKEPITQETSIQTAWLDTTGTNIQLVGKTITLPKTADRQQILETAFNELLTEPSASASYTTAIPEGTKLLDLTTTEEGVKVDLSSEFTQGGGSAAMSARLAQIVYTASSLDATTPVWISVQGQPLENLGGEGITVSQPITRQEFEANFTL